MTSTMTSLHDLLFYAHHIIINEEEVRLRDGDSEGIAELVFDHGDYYAFADQEVELDEVGMVLAYTVAGDKIVIRLMMERPMTTSDILNV